MPTLSETLKVPVEVDVDYFPEKSTRRLLVLARETLQDDSGISAVTLSATLGPITIEARLER